MRPDHLRCLAQRHFVLPPDSAHSRTVSPNRAAALERTGVDPLGVADLPDIRWEEECVYRAVIREAPSRRGIGGHRGQTLAAWRPRAALQRAWSQRPVRPGRVHPSERGVPYAGREYTPLRKDPSIEIRMSRQGNRWDNAACESFRKTLQYEEVYRREYRNLADARARIGRFLEDLDNEKRRPSAWQY